LIRSRSVLLFQVPRHKISSGVKTVQRTLGRLQQLFDHGVRVMSGKGKHTGKNHHAKPKHKKRQHATSHRNVKVRLHVDGAHDQNIEVTINPQQKRRDTNSAENQKSPTAWSSRVRAMLSHVVAILLSIIAWKIRS
jgi:hypothetical protein